MNDLIKALLIFAKYGDVQFPTHCEHDELAVVGYDIAVMSPEDVAKLDKLGFFWSDDHFLSFRYGSA